MASDKLNELAQQFKKTKLWKTIGDDDLFAVRLSDGETGYCCVRGETGNPVGLLLFVGDSGFQYLREMFDPGQGDFGAFLEPMENLDMEAPLRQNYLLFYFPQGAGRKNADDDNLIRGYLKRSGKLGNKKESAPVFAKQLVKSRFQRPGAGIIIPRRVSGFVRLSETLQRPDGDKGVFSGAGRQFRSPV